MKSLKDLVWNLFCFLDFLPNLRGGNSYHSSFDDPLGKGAELKADVYCELEGEGKAWPDIDDMTAAALSDQPRVRPLS